MLFAVVISDTVWQAIIAALLVVYMEWSRRQTAAKVEQAAIKVDRVAVVAEKAAANVEEVKTTLQANTTATAARLDGIADVGNQTHKIVNSQRTEMIAKIDGLEAKINDRRVEDARGGIG